jgi:hypothetical protein
MAGQVATSRIAGNDDSQGATHTPKSDLQAAYQAKPRPASPTAKRIDVGKNVWFEKDGEQRRVLVQAVVCRRTDLLEQFMCRRMTKEHEAIVASDCDARDIHKALLLAGAEPGSPIKFQPKFTPASGPVIKVYVEYEENGKVKKVPAQQWIRNAATKKELDIDWVFAGSMLLQNQLDPEGPPIYLANDGDVICLANFESALLDLPIVSTKDNDDLLFEAFTERIPPLETPVTIILEAVPPAKQK